MIAVYTAPFYRNTGWARALAGGLALYVLLLVAMAASNVNQFRLLYRLTHHLAVTTPQAQQADKIANVLNNSNMLATVILGILFLTWFYRAHRNLPALGSYGLQHTPGWAIGAFFVPIITWYRPYQIMREIWKASDPSIPADAPYAWPEAPGTAIIGWWWGLWISRQFFSQAAALVARRTVTPEDLLRRVYWSSGGQIVMLGATVLLILLVLQVDRRQEARRAIITGDTSHFYSG